jgi:peroxiredoxin
MVATNSAMVQLGTKIPLFSLKEVTTHEEITVHTFDGKKGLLVMFICCHCPYVKHVQEELSKIGKDFENAGLGILAINSNDTIQYPDDSPQNMKQMAKNLDFRFPYGYDETQKVAQAFQAVCTPDFFLYDDQRCLVYRGQLDDSRPGNGKPVTGKELREAIQALLSGNSINSNQKPSLGCSIKWKSSEVSIFH